MSDNVIIMLFLFAGYAFMIFTHMRIDNAAARVEALEKDKALAEHARMVKKYGNTNLQD